MRRTVIAILLVVLLGLLTSIALAWSLRLGIITDSRYQLKTFHVDGWEGSISYSMAQTGLGVSTIPTVGRPKPLTVPVSRSLARHTIVFDSQRMLRERWGRIAETTELPRWMPYLDPEPAEYSWISSTASGWPLRCLRDYSERVRSGPMPYWNYEYHGQFYGDNPVRLASSTEEKLPRSLPYIPIWTGLIGNTVVYGLAWAMFIPLGYVVRRLGRRRRCRKGRCPQCKYELRDSAERCPECGWTAADSPRFIGGLIVPFYTAVSFVLLFTLVGAVIVMISRREPLPAITRAAYTGDTMIIELELERDALLLETPQDVPMAVRAWALPQRVTPMEAAILGNQPETVELLVRYGAPVNMYLPCGLTPIQLAIDWGNTDVVRALLNVGAEPCWGINNCEKLLASAVSARDQELLHLLLDAGVPMSGWAMTRATWEHKRYLNYCYPPSPHVPMIQHLIEVDAPIPSGALFNLVDADDADMLALLLENGGDVSVVHRGYPLLCAADQGNMSIEVATLLIEHGADVNATNPKGSTPLQIAILSDQMELARLLLENGADPSLLNGAARQLMTPELRSLIQSTGSDSDSAGP